MSIGLTSAQASQLSAAIGAVPRPASASVAHLKVNGTDRKSTRLNSSHRTISYAVFCLKKKKISVMNSQMPIIDAEQFVRYLTNQDYFHVLSRTFRNKIHLHDRR